MKGTAPLEIYSLFALLQSIVIRVLILAVIVYCATSFNENPPVLGTLIVALTLLLLSSGMDVIHIYPDRFEHVSTAMVPLLRKTKTFYYADIRNVEAEGPANHRERLLTGSLKWNNIHITKNDKEVVTISSYLYMEKLTEAVRLINKNIKS